MSPRALLLLLAAALLSSGCYTLNAQLPGALRSDIADDDVEVLESFSYERSHTYFLWGLVGDPAEDVFAAELERVAAEREADGVANLAFESYFTVADLLLSNVTLGLVAPRTYRLRGDVVRISAPPMPGRALLGDERRRRKQRERSEP